MKKIASLAVLIMLCVSMGLSMVSCASSAAAEPTVTEVGDKVPNRDWDRWL